jgi:hypothetical protein
MLLRMSDAQQASEAARQLANARWRGQVASRAAAVTAERIAELGDEQVLRLAHAAAEEAARRAAVARAEGTA